MVTELAGKTRSLEERKDRCTGNMYHIDLISSNCILLNRRSLEETIKHEHHCYVKRKFPFYPNHYGNCRNSLMYITFRFSDGSIDRFLCIHRAKSKSIASAMNSNVVMHSVLVRSIRFLVKALPTMVFTMFNEAR